MAMDPRTEAQASRPRYRRGEGGLLQAEILDAAVRLIGRSGDAEALSIRMLSHEVGVTAPSIYRHFADKSAILRAVLERSFALFDEHLNAAAEGARTPFDALRRRCEAYLAFADDQPGHYRVLFSAASLGPRHLGLGRGPHPGRPSFDALVGSVQACIDAGAKPPGREAHFVATLLWSTLHGFADLRIGKPEMPWPDGQVVVRHLLESLRLDGPAT